MFRKYLDPKNDVAFKKIFGTEKNKDILIHFLNDMLTFKEHKPIIDVTFLKTIQDPEIMSKKTSIVDILCKDESGNTYIVEMQVAKERGFENRAQYYASKAYISQTNAGGQYHDLKEIIFLAIADYVMFPNKSEYIADHVILDKKTHENDFKDFSFTFVELAKFDKTVDQLKTLTDKWSYFFKHAEGTSNEDIHKIIGNDQIFEKVFHELERFNWNDQEILTYDQSEKYEGAYLASLAYQYDEGEKKGREEREKKEREEGKTEGEKAASIKIAKVMLTKGLSAQEVSEFTSLSIKEVEQL